MSSQENFVVGVFEFQNLDGSGGTVTLVRCHRCSSLVARDDVTDHWGNLHPEGVNVPHPVLDRLGIVPVFREDKIDGSDVASITLAEAYKLAHIINDAETILRRHSLRGGLETANREARRILLTRGDQ